MHISVSYTVKGPTGAGSRLRTHEVNSDAISSIKLDLGEGVVFHDSPDVLKGILQEYQRQLGYTPKPRAVAAAVEPEPKPKPKKVESKPKPKQPKPTKKSPTPPAASTPVKKTKTRRKSA